MSHETYTPARGGSAAAEINALRHVFGRDADSVVITNTKGFTGHAMGAGIEEVVAVKALETGIVPPVPNFREIDPELGAPRCSVRVPLLCGSDGSRRLFRDPVGLERGGRAHVVAASARLVPLLFRSRLGIAK